MLENVAQAFHKCEYAIPWIRELKGMGFNVYYLSNYSEFSITAKSALQHISAKTLSFVQTVLALFFCGVLCTGRNVEPGRHCGRGDYHVVRTVGKYSIVSTVFSINTLV